MYVRDISRHRNIRTCSKHIITVASGALDISIASRILSSPHTCVPVYFDLIRGTATLLDLLAARLDSAERPKATITLPRLLSWLTPPKPGFAIVTP